MLDGMFQGCYNDKEYHAPDLQQVLDRAFSAGAARQVRPERQREGWAVPLSPRKLQAWAHELALLCTGNPARSDIHQAALAGRAAGGCYCLAVGGSEWHL